MKERIESIEVGSVNGNSVYSRRMENYEAPFHIHDETEEMFIVQSGTLFVDLEDDSVKLSKGDSYTVISGVSHRARVPGSAEVLVISRGFDA